MPPPNSDASWDCSEACLSVGDQTLSLNTSGDAKFRTPSLQGCGDDARATVHEYHTRVQNSSLQPGDLCNAGWWSRPLLAALQPEMCRQSRDVFRRAVRVGTLCSGMDSPLIALQAPLAYEV